MRRPAVKFSNDITHLVRMNKARTALDKEQNKTTIQILYKNHKIIAVLIPSGH